MDTEEKKLIEFWSGAMELSEEDKEKLRTQGPEDVRDMAPSEKLYLAAQSLGRRKKVLDYGCGSGWAGIIAARSGCPDVTAVDPAIGAAGSAGFYASLFGVEGAVHTECIDTAWLGTVPAGIYDGFFCSNVLDVIPPESAQAIIRESARITTEDASVIIGLNFYMSPEAAAARGIELADGTKVYMDGVLRLVSRSDEEWANLFSPWYEVEKLEHFAWPGEKAETRRMFYLKKK